MRNIKRGPAALGLLCGLIIILGLSACGRGAGGRAEPTPEQLRAQAMARAAALSAEAQESLGKANALGAEAQKTEASYAEKDLQKEREEIGRRAGQAADQFLQSASLFLDAANKLDEAGRLEHVDNALKIYFAAKSREYKKHAELVTLRGDIPSFLSRGQIQSIEQFQATAEEVGRRAAKLQAEEQRHHQEAEQVRTANSALFQEIAEKLPS